MKKFFITILCCMTALLASAQTTTADKLKVSLKDGSVVTYNIADIDSLWFVETAPQTTKVYKVTIPKEFEDNSYVFDIIADDGETKIGEVCSEYIRSYGNVDDTHTVVYSILKDEQGNYLSKVNLASCLDVTTGATISWDTEHDSIASYTAAATPGALTEVYITPDGNILTEAPTGIDIVEADTIASLINDIRGSEYYTYKIVKIGTQYWMADNLRTKVLTDGTSLTLHTCSDLSGWKSETGCAYMVPLDETDEEAYAATGAMYNPNAAANENIAPTGWTVPESSDFTTLKGYLKTKAGAKMKAIGGFYDGGEDYPCTNVTNFSANADGYFFAATDYGYVDSGSRVYYWTKTQGTSGSGYYVPVQLYKSSNTLYMPEGGHNYYYGHFIRCIKK